MHLEKIKSESYYHHYYYYQGKLQADQMLKCQDTKIRKLLEEKWEYFF